jgi:hypothetical protein
MPPRRIISMDLSMSSLLAEVREVLGKRRGRRRPNTANAAPTI